MAKRLLFLFVGLTSLYKKVYAEDNIEDVEIYVSSTEHSLQIFLNTTNPEYRLHKVTCVDVANNTIDANEDNVCEDLAACSTYTILVNVVNNEEAFEKRIEAHTNSTKPIIAFNAIVPSTNTLNITWTTSDDICVDLYIINIAIANNNTVLSPVVKDKKECIIKDLNPCVKHDITLRAMDFKGETLAELTDNSTTEKAEPGNVTLKFINETDGRINVTWQPPIYNTCITEYHLIWFLTDCFDAPRSIDSINDKLESSEVTTVIPDVDANNCQWNISIPDPTLTEYTISNLYGCEVYGFKMRINDYLTDKAYDKFTTSEQVSSVKPKILQSATEVSIEWDPPEYHKKCVKQYIVTITGPEQENETTQTQHTSNNSVHFKNICPCGKYKVSVVIESLNGSKGIASEDNFEMEEGIPTMVESHKVLTEPHRLNISWERPSFAYLCVKEYHVTGWTDDYLQERNFSETTIGTQISIDKLSSCQPYTVQIIPTTIKNNDGIPKRIETSTSAVIAQGPTRIEVIGLYPDRLELSAQESDFNNNCEIISAKFECEPQDPNPLFMSAEHYAIEGQLGGISFQAMLSPLSPNVGYVCHVSLFNIAGWSEKKPIVRRTEPYFPDRPEGIRLKSSSSNNLTFNWEAPSRTNGDITIYKLYFQMYEPDYYIPPSCTIQRTESSTRETTGFEQTFAGLLPYTKYSFQVTAQNVYGSGEYTRPFIVTTKPAASEPVLKLQTVSDGPDPSNIEYQANVSVSFLAPCKSNGVIQHILFEFIGDRKNYTREYFTREEKPNFDKFGNMTYQETALKPEFNYTVSVSIKVEGVETLSHTVRSTFDAPAGIPKVPEEDILMQAKVNAFDSNRPTRTAVVRFPDEILNSDSGTIIYMALILSEKVCTPVPQMRFGVIDSVSKWPDTPSWNDVYNNKHDCVEEYQTTPDHWIPKSSRAIGKDLSLRFTPNDNEIVYIIGTENCADGKTKYCNGPLQPDTEYTLVFRLFTKSGFRDAYMIDFKTDSLIQVTLILISVCSCLFVAFVAGLIYLWVTKRIQWKRHSYHDIGDAFGDIIPKNFATYYQDIAKPEKIAREFKELSAVAMNLSFSASEMGCTKNRYADIFPYDKNRVILDIDSEGSDYINASFIDGYNRKKEYIATQGPKPESTIDFWRMILQYNVRVIVMVTQFKEGDVVKCHKYFPFNSKGIVVTVKKVDTLELYDRTEINVNHEKFGLKEKVIHYFFKKWPDRGVPEDPNHLISFLRKVKAEKIPRYSPIVVHCSAGVGRTGTFIALDILMQRLKNESKINIYETVKKLRFQRMKMVQTSAQYTFLYTCTYELVKHKKQKQNYNKGKSGKSVSFQDMPELKDELPPKANISKSNNMFNLDLEMHQKSGSENDTISLSTSNNEKDC